MKLSDKRLFETNLKKSYAQQQALRSNNIRY